MHLNEQYVTLEHKRNGFLKYIIWNVLSKEKSH